MFQDAIEITRTLGFQYLWIDSICIIQDSRQDWQMESMTMDRYYMSASLNISASAGAATDSSQGIFSTADKDRAVFFPYAVVPSFSKEKGLEGNLYFRRAPEREPPSPLRNRAWVLQERQLSPRILWCGHNYMRWQCNNIQASDAFPIFQKPYLQLQGRIFELNTTARPQDENEKKQEALDYWYRTVEDFMTLDISFPDDRLPAIAGLAKILALRTGYRYLCGLWEEDLLTGLFWSAHREKDGVEGSTSPPSWSWARLPTLPTLPLTHLAVKEQMFRRARAAEFVPGYDAEVLQAQIVNFDGDIYGQVKSASLTLRGRWQSCCGLDGHHFDPEEDWVDEFSDGGDSYITRESRKPGETKAYTEDESEEEVEECAIGEIREVIYYLDNMDEEELDALPAEAIYFQLRKRTVSPTKYNPESKEYEDTKVVIFHALILEPGGDSGERYRRIGIAEIPETMGDDDWGTKTVVIV